MKKLLEFLKKLEERNIHYRLEHNRDDYIMVLVVIPGERWEVEFSAEGDVLIEIFKGSDGVHSDEVLLEDIFTIHDGLEFSIHITLHQSADSEVFLERFVRDAIEANRLAVGGNPFDAGCTVSKYARGSVAEKTRQAVAEWILNQPEVADFAVGSLFEGTPLDEDSN